MIFCLLICHEYMLNNFIKATYIKIFVRFLIVARLKLQG